MEIKVHDAKKQKKETNAEIVIPTEAAEFFASGIEFNLSVFNLRTCNWKISQQRDRPDSMNWSIIRRLESGQTVRNKVSAVRVRKCVTARS